MMQGRPKLVFGDEQVPNQLDLQKKTSKFSGLEQGKNFAAHLSTATQGAGAQNTQPIIQPSSPSGGVFGAISMMGAAQPQVSPQNVVKRVISPSAGRMAFGMEDTRPSTQNNKHLRPATGVDIQASAATIQAQTSSTKKLTKQSPEIARQAIRSQTIASDFGFGELQINSSPYRGLQIMRDVDGALGMRVAKNKKSASEYKTPLLAGNSTQALLHMLNTTNASLAAQGSTTERRVAQKELPVKGVVPIPKNPAPVLAQTFEKNTEVKQATTLKLPLATMPAQVEGLAFEDGVVGALSAKYESGEKGSATVGYDRHGGTSYGKYQFSSRAGTVQKFIEFLQSKAPDLADQLASSGQANTGGRYGRMPSAWQKIAQEQPVRFEELQREFIMGSHFEPAMTAIAQSTGIPFGSMPDALQEVVFSTAVQHGVGGATRIVSRAMRNVGMHGENLQSEELIADKGQDLIKQIYSIRSRQFGSSTQDVRAAVKNRLHSEMREALNMLNL